MIETRPRTRGSGTVPLGSRAYALLLAVLVAFGLHAAFIAGPAMRVAAQDDLLRTIAREDRQFCDMFGMRFGTDAFVACSRELSNVRQRQLDRDTAATEGIL